VDTRLESAYVRALAAETIIRVEQGRYLDAVLDEIRSRDPAAASQSALLQELAYGTLRWFHQLNGIAQLFLQRPLSSKDADIRSLLLVGLYQLRHMRVPEYAAVDVTVAAADVLKKTWAKGLLNACLRSYLRETERVEQAVAASTELRYSYPTWLLEATRRDYPNDWPRILDANNERPPMTLRVNEARISRRQYCETLESEGIAYRMHGSVGTAVVLKSPTAVDKLPGFREGWFSIQDAAAQLAAPWLDAHPNERVLDACAAPGGKAAHIYERTPSPLRQLTALDSNAERAERMQANFARLGVTATCLVADAADPAQWWDGEPYDRILVDAPCSATGVIRRHPDIKLRRKPEDLEKLEQSQARLLDGVWPCLVRGGRLLYVTCSILCRENDRQVQGFVARHRDADVETLSSAGTSMRRQTLPGEEDMDGFYYAALRKK
jgi:16S rRNA (cytosine967-C5)-methyltransferase